MIEIFWIIFQMIFGFHRTTSESLFDNDAAVVRVWKRGIINVPLRSTECKYRIWDDNIYEFDIWCTGNKYPITVTSFLPENTTMLQIYEGYFTPLKSSPFQNLSKIRYLDLTGNSIHDISDTVFKGLNELQTLNLGRNFIKQLPEKIFWPCPKLTELDLSSNYIFHVRVLGPPLRSLTNLEALILKDNYLLNNIFRDDFDALSNSSLKKLDLSNCLINYIDPHVFNNLPNLRDLRLSYNTFTNQNLTLALTSLPNTSIEELHLRGLKQLTKFPTDALRHLSSTQLKTLILSETRIWEIERNFFPSFPHLRHLEMDRSELKDIDDNAFDSLPKLQHLSLVYNQLTAIPSGISDCTGLKVLDISRNSNPINTKFMLENRAFSNNKELETINFDNTPVKQIYRYSLFGLTNIKRLDFSKCSIISIEDFSFEALKSLETLDLRSNLLRNSLTQDTFAGLVNLKQLYLTGSLLRMNDPTYIFKDLINIEALFLGTNELHVMFPRKALEMMPKLEILTLESNAITSWDEQSFPSNFTLQYLDLSFNKIFTVTPAMLQDFNKTERLSISNNPFNCSACELQQFIQWSNTTNVSIRNKHSAKCRRPDTLTNESVFEINNFDHCISNPGVKAKLTMAIVLSSTVLLLIFAVGFGMCYYLRWYIRYWWFLSRAKVKSIREYLKEDKFRYDAFVSYNVNDQNWVLQQLLPKLEEIEPKVRLCLHERDFEVGREIIDNIVHSIENSRKVVLLLSNSFLTSQWCNWEMNLAQFKLMDEARDALVLVLLEPIEKEKMSSTLTKLVKTWTYLPWPHNLPQAENLFWNRLRKVLQRPEAGSVTTISTS